MTTKIGRKRSNATLRCCLKPIPSRPRANPASRARHACARAASIDLPQGFVWLDGVTPGELHWLWAGRLPLAKLCLVEGESNAGKSTLMRAVVASVTTGRALPGDVSRDAKLPQAVFWMSTEEDPAVDILPALAAAGADTAQVAVLGVDRDWQPVDANMAALERAVLDHSVALIVLDAGKDFVGELPDETEIRVRAVCRPWVKLAARTGVCVAFLRHWRKGSGPASQRGAGSLAWRAVARHSIAVAKRGTQRIVAVEKQARAGTVPSLAFTIADDGSIHWDGEVEVTADQLAAHDGSGPLRLSRFSEAVRALEGELAGGERPAADVRRTMMAEGFTGSTIDRAAKEAGIVRAGAGKSTMWRMPD